MTIACDAPANTGTAYSLTMHACRYCGCRVLQSGDTFRCGNCKAVCMGRPEEICGCGAVASWGAKPPRATPPKGEPAKPEELTHWKGPRPFRCVPNPAISAMSPSEVVILFGDELAA